jgi:hypothetical protein
MTGLKRQCLTPPKGFEKQRKITLLPAASQRFVAAFFWRREGPFSFSKFERHGLENFY